MSSPLSPSPAGPGHLGAWRRQQSSSKLWACSPSGPSACSIQRHFRVRPCGPRTGSATASYRSCCPSSVWPGCIERGLEGMRVDRSVDMCHDTMGGISHLCPSDAPPVELLGHPPEDMKRGESERSSDRGLQLLPVLLAPLTTGRIVTGLRSADDIAVVGVPLEP